MTDREWARIESLLPVSGGGTPYTRWGDWFAWLCLALTALSVAAALGRRAPTGP